jgi:hypothetical protein
LNTADGGTTRWIGFGGRWRLAQYNDWICAAFLVPTGASGANQTAVPGATGFETWGFTGAATTDNLMGTFEFMHDYKEGSDVYPHIHWSGTNNNAGNVKWQFIYIIEGALGEFSAPVTLTVTAANPGLGPNGRPVHKVSEFAPAISGAGLAIGTQLRFILRRDPTDNADTYGSTALMWDVGIHYLSDSAGSLQRFVK